MFFQQTSLSLLNLIYKIYYFFSFCISMMFLIAIHENHKHLDISVKRKWENLFSLMFLNTKHVQSRSTCCF
jgi:hypothetical protein